MNIESAINLIHELIYEKKETINVLEIEIQKFIRNKNIPYEIEKIWQDSQIRNKDFHKLDVDYLKRIRGYLENP